MGGEYLGVFTTTCQRGSGCSRFNQSGTKYSCNCPGALLADIRGLVKFTNLELMTGFFSDSNMSI